MDLRERIKAARNNLGITQDELAKYSGISIQNIKKLESKENTNPTNNTLQKLAIALKVDSDYFVSQLSPNIVSQSKKSVSQLSPNQKKSVPQSKNFPQTLNDDIVSIPFYEDIRASAGSGAYNEVETAEQLNFPKSFLRQYFGIISFNNLSIIIGSGDSMFPTLPENCYLVIQQGNVKEGEICVARIEDELYVKRLQKLPKLKLLSDNKAYDSIELDGSNFEIIGRVVGYFKKTSL
ncbi:XRE family transcriptional regulator [Helicobacter rodentium]|uniref:XRE family transcriptional regulator n=1 Tax=Helicobacter rodentium TaxID=59617 RepID=UPI00047881BC|nr:XRE family transcriptional regulator [Helicobacter rodentium]